MSDSKSWATASKRRNARLIKVAPVTRAIRAALAISATTLALTAGGAAFAGNISVAAAPTALHYQAAPFAVQQPVVDLTLVTGDRVSSVFDAFISAQAGAVSPSSIQTLAASDASPPQTFGNVQNMTLVAGGMPGPGGVSGTDNQVGSNNPGIIAFSTIYGWTVTSTTGYADAIFASGSGIGGGTSGGNISATGYTWAAGIEVEATDYARGIGNTASGTITASASGAGGQAWGIYAVAANDVQIYNAGTINVSASGVGGTAIGLYAGASNGAAAADNSGTINATASGDYGSVWGVYVAAYTAAVVRNSGYISLTATGIAGNATGMSANAGYGDAIAYNAGGISVSAGGNAIGLYAYSTAGNASVTNTNTGSITAASTAGLADGIFASGVGAYVTNDGAISASGYSWAAGIEAQGTDLATVTNGGTITATATGNGGQAFGIYATGDTTGARVSNTSSITATAVYGTADGIYANGGAGSVSIDNFGSIYAQGYYANGIVAVSGGAIGITNTGVIGAYNAALAVGISASNNYAASDITVSNDTGASIFAFGYYGGTGIDVAATGAGSSVSVVNGGDITAVEYGAVGYGATGIQASGDLNASIDNSGSITATNSGGSNSVGAYGAVALAFNGIASVTNSGAITAYGYTGVGIVASSSNGTASVDNSGSIDVQASYIGAGIQANGLSGASVTNSGAVSSKYAAYGYGISAISGNGDAAISNADTGSIFVLGAAFGIGEFALSTYGDVALDNAGLIQALSLNQAVGQFGASTNGNASVSNGGNITAYGQNGPSVGAFARANNGDAAIENSGTIEASSYNGTAAGVRATGLTSGISNSGAIYATSYYSQATGIDVYGASSASVSNDGYVGARTVYSGNARGIYAIAGGDVTVANGAAGVVDAQAPAAGSTAMGVFAYSIAGNASITNAGAISAVADSGVLGAYAGAYADATVTNSGSVGVSTQNNNAIGVGGYSATGAVTLTSSGSISADAVSGSAFGMSGTAATGDVTIDNSGTIAASVTYGSAMGSRGFAALGDVTLTNSGSISAYASSGNAIGMSGYAGTGNVSIDNTATGVISSEAVNGNAFGIYGYAVAGNVDILNGGDIQSYGSTTAWGIYAGARGAGGSATASNTGSISVNQSNKYGNGAFGIRVIADGSAAIDNTGSITTVSAGRSYGATAISLNGDATVTSAGDITVSSSSFKYSAVGIASFANAGLAAASNSGNVSVDAFRATGILANGYAGATIDNTGAVSVTGSKYASGASAMSEYGDATVTNGATGTVDVSATSSYGFAVGMVANATQGDASVVNAGQVSATSGQVALGLQSYSQYGNASTTNSGDVSSSSSYAGQSLGLLAVADAGEASVVNSGSVDASAYNGSATGVYAAADAGLVTIDNAGSVTASSTYGGAVGVNAQGNSGGISNSGSVQATGYTAATGAQLVTYNDGLLVNTAAGSINASSRGNAYGAFVNSQMGVASLDNAGSIDAVNTYTGGSAIGAFVYGNAGASVTNSGTISATSATGSLTLGVIAQAYGNVVVTNSGAILATDDDYAVGVSMDSVAGTATLVNSGVIRTYSTSEGEVAVRGGDGVQRVINYGDIYGAVITGGGDDVFANGNGGVWQVTNNSTDFGAGDDAITNGSGGTIVLANGSIRLGSSTAAGNSFTNNGKLLVQGTGLIDMGTGVALVPSLNALPLVNNGVIDFVDGAPDDMLTINGDLSGNGAINVDISPLNLTSDLLYVDGSMATGAVQTVNVNFAGLPTSQYTGPIAFAYVEDDSTAGSFVGGQVIGFNQATSFLNLQVNVISAIDASNATDDVFSVGVRVAGLNDTGTLAASLASGAQSLMSSQIGTWRQRMGVLPQQSKEMVGLSPWIRAFSDKGEVNPSHASNFGSGGNFGYDQSNSGSELGMNVNFGGGVNAGVLFAKSDATQRLMAGAGSNRINGSAFGLYGTWIGGNGFYVDASYRWIGFDADLRSAAGLQKTDGAGNAFNVEAGFTAWTMGGVDITPQAQYTRSRVGDIRPIRGEMANFVANGGTSTRGRLGVALSKTIQGAGWIWTPYGSVNAIREFDGETRYTVANTFTGSVNTEGTSAMVELGVGAQKNGVSVTGGANWTDGGALKSFLGGQLVLRYTW